MFEVIKPPYRKLSIFLAGSIEMGLAEDWKSKNEKELDGLDVTIYNPRRDSWDSSWVQSIHNEQFREQVEWELSAMTTADVIPVYFDPTTKSPITLLELGLFHKKMIVCCPEGFWRKGNVDILCTRENVPVFEDLKSAIGALKTRINQSLI
jgi:hypothetical protein